MTRPYLSHHAGWKIATLAPDNPESEIVVAITSGSTPSTSVPEYWDGDIPWLTPKEITRNTGGIYISRTERTITAQGLRNSAAKLMPAGTVMLTKRAPIGAVVVNAVPMATNQGFLNFKCGKLLDPIFLCFWFRANKPYLDAVANGSTYPELYPGDLFEFEIALPSIAEQRQITRLLLSLELAIGLGDILESSADEIRSVLEVQRETRNLVKLRDMLLPRLLTGDVSMKDVDLLEVIP